MNDTTTRVEDEPASPTTPPARQRRLGRRIGLAAAFVLILSGVAMLGYVGWQYYGTDIVAQNRQADLRETIKAQWQHPTVGAVLGPEAAAPALGSAASLMRIPRFGADYEVPLIEGVRDEDLELGIGHFPGTGPGQIGNFALAGHRVTNGEPFRGLPDLRPGDEVIIETAEATYTYVLDTDPNDLVVPFTDTWVIEPVPIAPEGQAPPRMPTFASTEPTKAIITLTSSSEIFHTDDRMIAFGHLVDTTPK